MSESPGLVAAIKKITPWLELWFEPGQVTELRILEAIDNETNHKHTDAGFFKYEDLHRLIRIALASYENRCKGAYIIPNPINPELHKRCSKGVRRAKRDDLTTDADILERRWLIIDVDPVRPAAVSATDSEKNAACELTARVREYLRAEFDATPTIEEDTGNGNHLYYRLAEALPVVLPLADDDILAQCLRHLADRFDTPEAKIDISVFNPSRIVKLVGSRSCKGVDSPDRPHRRAKLLASAPANRISLDSLARLASLAPARKIITKAKPVTPVGDRRKLIACAEKYMSSLDPAVSGNHGHDQTYHAAAVLRVGFDLTFDEAWPIMMKFNDEKCVPPWAESELEKKLMDADHADGVRGERVPDMLRDPSERKAARLASQTTVQEGDGDAPRSTFSNFRLDEITDGDTVKQVKIGMEIQDVHANLLAITKGWPRRIGTALFAQAKDYQPIWINSVSGLFGWIFGVLGETKSIMNWSKGDRLTTKEEFYKYLQFNAEACDAIERFPHHPPMKNIYYMHPEFEPVESKALSGLLSEFAPSTPDDYILIRAFFVSLFWGGPVGARPAWLFCGEDNDSQAGRGVGKTTIVEMAGALLGSYITLSPNSDERDVQTRLLSPVGLESRLVLFDNLKSLHLSSSLLESLLTIGTISGRALHIGESSRPNNIVWTLTFNEPSFSKDLSQRCIMIRLARPVHDPAWRGRVLAYIAANRWQIISDCIAILQRPAKPLTTHTRWATWEGDVLSKILCHSNDADDLIRMIEERRIETDDDSAIADDLADWFRTVLRREGYEPDTQKIRIFNSDAAAIINSYTNKKESSSKAMKFLSLSKIAEIENFRTNKHRGIVWTGKDCPNNAQCLTFQIADSGR